MIVGLTGGIASGKSTIANMIKSLGIPVVDADIIAREVVLPGEKAYGQILEAFGEVLLLEDRTLDRKKLGSIVFNDTEKRSVLNQIVHPAVRERMNERKEAHLKSHESVVLDIPLLYESKLTHMVDRTLLVYVDFETQLTRLKERDGFSDDEALSRIRSQLSLEDKKEMADEIIDNTGMILDSKRQLIHIFSKWNIL